MPPCVRVTAEILNALVNSSFCRIVIGLSASLARGCDGEAIDEIIGISSLSHVNVNGKSPVPTTHWILTRSPTLTSRANSNGVIFGGTIHFFVRIHFNLKLQFCAIGVLLNLSANVQ